MTHPIVLEALASARQADWMRAADRNRDAVLARESRRRRARLASWLKAQLHQIRLADSRPGIDDPAPGWLGSPTVRC